MRRRRISLLLLLIIPLLISCDNKLPEINANEHLAMTINLIDKSISFIDSDKQEHLGEWQLSSEYNGGIFLDDHDTLLLYGKKLNSVHVYSISKSKLITKWKTGKGLTNGLLLTDGTIVFADQSTNTIRFFNNKGKEITSIATGNNPLTMMQGKLNEKVLYVISFNDKILSIVDLVKYQTVKSLKIQLNSTGATLNCSENEIWIGGHGDRDTVEDSIHVYDLETGKLKQTIDAPLMPINFINDGNYIYTLSHGTSTLYKFDKRGNLIGSLKVAANPFDMKIKNNHLIVAGYDSNTLNFINLETFSIVNTIDIEQGPFQIITGG